MFSTLRFPGFTLNVRSKTVVTRLTVGDIAFDATRIAGDARELCALSWWFGHRVSEAVGKEPTSVMIHEACACNLLAAWRRSSSGRGLPCPRHPVLDHFHSFNCT
jgi:hypothetical protein